MTSAVVALDTKRVETMVETDEIVLITPEIAADWLRRFGRKNNRKVSKSKALGHAEHMSAGRWLCSKEFAICFDTTGTLLNGHHRLVAIRDFFKMGVRCVVRRGVPVEALAFIDNHQRRSAQQRGRMLGIDTSWDPALRVIFSARAWGEGHHVAHDIVLERLRHEFAEASDVAAAGLKIRIGGRVLNAGSRAGILLGARWMPLEAIDFLADLQSAADRSAVGSKAVQNVVRWIELHRGKSSGMAQIASMEATVGGFIQFVNKESKENVRNGSLGGDKSTLTHLLRVIPRHEQ